MINNTTVENEYTTTGNIDTVYPITFEGATDANGLPLLKVVLTDTEGVATELVYNVDYALVYDDVQDDNTESLNTPHLNGISLLTTEVAVAGNSLDIVRTTPFVQPVDFQVGRIDPEQIERSFDLSVLRDQELKAGTADLKEYVDAQDDAVREIANDADEKADDAVQTAEEAKGIAEEAKDIAEDAKEIAEGIDEKAQTALDNSEEALDKITQETTDRQDADDALQVQITDNKDVIEDHVADTNNPHSVTKAQVGLGNVDNTSDLDKPISTATQTALDGKQNVSTANYQMGNASGGWTAMTNAQQDALNSGATTTNISQIATNTSTIAGHMTDTNNPHSVTKTQVGLGNVDNTSDLNKPISTATQNALDLKMPISTKYGAALSLTINSTTYVVTAQLKDQDGNNLGTAQTIDLPLESVVVSGAYDSTTKEVVLTLQDGSTIRFSVADLVSGLQTEITALNMLSADLVDDTGTTHKFVTTTEKSTWSGKQDAISDLATIRAGAALGATALQSGDNVSELTNDAGYLVMGDLTGFVTRTTAQTISGLKTFTADIALSGTTSIKNTTSGVSYTMLYRDTSGIHVGTSTQALLLAGSGTRPTFNGNNVAMSADIPTVNNPTITITQGGVTKGSFTLNQATGDTIALDAGGGGSYTAGTGIDITNDVISVADPVLINSSYNIGTDNITIGGTAAQVYNGYSLNIGTGSETTGYFGIAVGSGAVAKGTGSMAIGAGATAGTNALTNRAITIGNNVCTGDHSTLIGSSSSNTYTLSDSNTFAFANDNGIYKLVDANGRIPEARLADTTSATQGQVLTLDSNLNAVWAAGGGGSVAIDNTTITENASQEIQAVAVIDQNTGIAKTWTGTQAEYDAIATKDPETEYIITDDIGGPATVIAELAEELNGKADVSTVAHVVTEFQAPTADNGYTWYRKYADGWVEQGGKLGSAGSYAWRNITLAVPMADTNYTAVISGAWSDATGNGSIIGNSKTTTGFNTYATNVDANGAYFVAGMAA